MNARIIIDSTADLPQAVREKCAVVPMTVTFGDQEYIDGVTLDRIEFYEKLVQCDTLPTTSQASPAAFAQEFQKAVDAGQKAVVLTVSSKLSGTYQSATIAAMDFPGSIFVVDTQSAAIGSGILAELAVQLAQSGMAAEDIARKITAERENVRLIAVLDTLEYLKKGGRISKTVAFAGELLSIKPVISLQDGEVHILGKARGSKQGNIMLSKEILATGGVDFTKPVLLGYTGTNDILLQKYITESAELWQCHEGELHSAIVGSAIGTHVGPGGIAAAFFKK